MTKRSRSICTILAIIFAVLLEVSTMRVMKYNAFFVIVSTVLYFATFLFAVIDVYCTFRKGFNKYHFFLAIRDVSVFGVQLAIYYLLGNLQGMESLELIIVMALAVIFSYIAIKFGKLAKKNCTYTYPE